MDEETPDKPARHGTPWTADEERRLYDAFRAGVSVGDLAATHERRCGGIRSHLKKLGLLDEDGNIVDPPPGYTPTAAAQKRTEKAAARALKKAAADDYSSEKPVELNPCLTEALRLLSDTTQSVFITGKAGTGKSTLLKHFRRHTSKNVVVLAPTGIAALNVNGQTIHGFFRFSIDVTPQKIAGQKKIRNPKLYKKIDTLVIDEVSMVRADIFDCVDAFLRLHGPHPGQSFGGVQMVLIGDLYQLPPVVGAAEREIFQTYYETPYFFSAHALRDFPLARVELEKVYRQKDENFVALLNRVRDDTVTARDLETLNARVGATAGQGADRTIHLTTTNRRADEINLERLNALKGRSLGSAAEIKGDFARDYYPAPTDLAFKIGAQVMMLTNDREGRWVNGSVGVIDALGKDVDQGDYVSVRLHDGDEPVAVFRHAWEVYKFALDSDQIQSEPVGTFTQFPFRLAWAVTIHKSQGKTFDRIDIDFGAGAFAAGQVYVALSRCTSLEGIALHTPIQRRHIRTDERIRDFMARCGSDAFQNKKSLIESALREGAGLDILYVKADGEETRRTVFPRDLGMKKYKDAPFLGMKAWCADSDQELMFSVDRILEIAPTRHTRADRHKVCALLRKPLA